MSVLGGKWLKCTIAYCLTWRQSLVVKMKSLLCFRYLTFMQRCHQLLQKPNSTVLSQSYHFPFKFPPPPWLWLWKARESVPCFSYLDLNFNKVISLLHILSFPFLKLFIWWFMIYHCYLIEIRRVFSCFVNSQCYFCTLGSCI